MRTTKHDFKKLDKPRSGPHDPAKPKVGDEVVTADGSRTKILRVKGHTVWYVLQIVAHKAAVVWSREEKAWRAY